MGVVSSRTAAAVRPAAARRRVDAWRRLAALAHGVLQSGGNPLLSYARALLLFTFGLIIRSIVVPSSAQRTLTLALVAACAPVATSYLWYGGQLLSVDSPVMHVIWTALWCLGTVVIATFASHVIFGLRQQVRDASQLGQYTLLEKIGEGGMGTVYRRDACDAAPADGRETACLRTGRERYASSGSNGKSSSPAG